MIPENHKKLIDKLMLATKNKKIIWVKTNQEDEYKAFIAGGAVTSDKWDSHDDLMMGFTPVSSADFAIWNDNGERIDYISASYPSIDYDTLTELHTLAKRNYFKIDETIDSISSQLDDLLSRD